MVIPCNARSGQYRGRCPNISQTRHRGSPDKAIPWLEHRLGGHSPSGLTKLNWHVERLSVSDDGYAHDLARPMFLDFREHLIDIVDPLVVDRDDQVGAFGNKGRRM